MVLSGGENLLRTEHLDIRGFDSRGINLTLSPGSRIGILGEAGSGKTSLLRTLARLDPLSSGKLFWGKAEVSQKSLWRMKKRQHYVSLLLANPYTLYEQKMRISTVLQDSEKESGKTAADLLQDKLIPAAVINQTVEALSGVMRIRLALTRIQQNQSPVVLIDDVFRFVIREMWQSVSNVITGIADGSQALLVASRYYECLREMDYILVMHQGEFIEGGPREELLSSPAHTITRRLVHYEVPDQMLTGLTDFTFSEEDAISSTGAEVLTPGHWVYPYQSDRAQVQ